MLTDEPAPKKLTAVKFFPPVLAANRVSRSHLIDRLQSGLAQHRSLTLVSAPAGYGKSTLVAEWSQQAGRPVAWLSLEEADDEPSRFCGYFLAALQQLDASLGKELSVVIHSGQLPPAAVLLSSLSNDLIRANQKFILVLDDYQVIQENYIHQVISGLTSSRLENLHLVLVTREDPPLPLARLRARNQLSEIRAQDLRFNLNEVEAFLVKGMGLHLSRDELNLLVERTEGWAAGVQLAGLSMQGRENPSEVVAGLSGGHRFILGYLAEEVLGVQAPEVQDFLLRTSILSQLSGPLCDAVSGRTDSSDLLEKLWASNLFLFHLDDERRWYRYHHLFAELLQTQLARSKRYSISELHRLAAQWFEDQNMPAEAVRHALAAGEFQRAVELLEKNVWEFLNQGLVRQVDAWLQVIPPEWRAGSVRTSLGYAWMHLLRGNFPASLDYLQQTRNAIAAGSTLPAETAELEAECLALESNLLQAQGRIPASIETAQQALQRLPGENQRISALAMLALGGAHRQQGDYDQAAATLSQAIYLSQRTNDPVTEVLAAAHLVLMSVQYGRLRYAAQEAEKIIKHMEHMSGGLPPAVGAIYGALGMVQYEWNQVDLALDNLRRSIQLGTLMGHNASVIYSKIALARLHQGRGDLAAASRETTEALDLLRQGAPGWLKGDIIARQVDLLVANRNLAAAEALLNQSGVQPGVEISHQNDSLQVAWLRLWMAQKDERAPGLAEKILQSAKSSRRDGTCLQALILGAQILADCGEADASHVWLAEALRLGEPEGYTRIFLDEGRAVAVLLEKNTNSVYGRSVLALFPHFEDESEKGPDQAGLIEPLTERELEVLRLLAQGMKYSEIAARLVVSLNTVRFHVKGIYSKLGVSKQSGAIARARQLGLL